LRAYNNKSVIACLPLPRTPQDYAPGDLATVGNAELAHSEFYGLNQKNGFTVNTGNPSDKADEQTYQFFTKETPNANYATGGVYEFKPLKSGDHSFHLHVWPLQAISFLQTSDSNCTQFDYEEGEYYDVWRCEGIARFTTVRFAGKAIHHCHMVKHEDTGLMGWFNVSGSEDEHEPNPCPQNNLYTCSDVFSDYTSASECAATNAPSGTPTAVQPTTTANPNPVSNDTIDTPTAGSDSLSGSGMPAIIGATNAPSGNSEVQPTTIANPNSGSNVTVDTPTAGSDRLSGTGLPATIGAVIGALLLVG
jgi:hypothetical protein